MSNFLINILSSISATVKYYTALHGHVTAFWAVSNQLIFTTGCSVLWSHDHDLWLFCQLPAKKCPFGRVDWDLQPHVSCNDCMICLMTTLTTGQKISYCHSASLKYVGSPVMCSCLPSYVIISVTLKKHSVSKVIVNNRWQRDIYWNC